MSSEIKKDGNRLHITRVFQAPRPLVFSYWAQAEKLQQWSGCKDAHSCTVEMDFRVGGSFLQKMQIKNVGEFTIRGTYDEILAPERIAYHADLGGAITRVIIEFIEEGVSTRVVLTQEGLPDEFSCQMVSQGTSESFDKLDLTLTQQAASA